MNLIKSGIFAALAGALGAGIWSAISYAFNFEIGWLAWGIGFLVGMGALIGAGGKGGLPVAVLAVAISILSVAAGKYASVHFAVASFVKEQGMTAFVEDDVLMSYLADDIVNERTDAGEELAWPNGSRPDMPEAEGDYPPDVWAEMTDRWYAMSDDERSDYSIKVADMRRAMIAEFAAATREQAFKSSFTLWDLLWFGLAIFTSFKIGMSQRETGEGDPNAPMPTPAS